MGKYDSQAAEGWFWLGTIFGVLAVLCIVLCVFYYHPLSSGNSVPEIFGLIILAFMIAAGVCIGIAYWYWNDN